MNARPASTTHLPLQVTRFFGREAELARLLQLLAPAGSVGCSALSVFSVIENETGSPRLPQTPGHETVLDAL